MDDMYVCIPTGRTLRLVMGEMNLGCEGHFSKCKLRNICLERSSFFLISAEPNIFGDVFIYYMIIWQGIGRPLAKMINQKYQSCSDFQHNRKQQLCPVLLPSDLHQYVPMMENMACL